MTPTMSDMEQATVVPVTAISAISLKLPPFWPKHPDTHAFPKLKHSSLLVEFLSPPNFIHCFEERTHPALRGFQPAEATTASK